MATTNNSGQGEKDTIVTDVIFHFTFWVFFLLGLLAGQAFYEITHDSPKGGCKKGKHKSVEVVVPSNP